MPCVPTGIKIGVSTVECGKTTCAQRAFVVEHLAKICTGRSNNHGCDHCLSCIPCLVAIVVANICHEKCQTTYSKRKGWAIDPLVWLVHVVDYRLFTTAEVLLGERCVEHLFHSREQDVARSPVVRATAIAHPLNAPRSTRTEVARSVWWVCSHP